MFYRAVTHWTRGSGITAATSTTAKAAAHWDDALNFIPARITAGATSSRGDWPVAISPGVRTMIATGSKTASPKRRLADGGHGWSPRRRARQEGHNRLGEPLVALEPGRYEPPGESRSAPGSSLSAVGLFFLPDGPHTWRFEISTSREHGGPELNELEQTGSLRGATFSTSASSHPYGPHRERWRHRARAESTSIRIPPRAWHARRLRARWPLHRSASGRERRGRPAVDAGARAVRPGQTRADGRTRPFSEFRAGPVKMGRVGSPSGVQAGRRFQGRRRGNHGWRSAPARRADLPLAPQ